MMKRYIMLFVMIFSVMLVILLLIKPREEFHVLYRSTSYSMKQTQKNDSFQVVFLASDKSSFYLDPNYIVRASIKNPLTKEQVSLDVHGVTISSDIVMMSKPYHQVTLDLALSIHIEDYEIIYQEAVLELVYENEEMLRFDMGEFFYIEDHTNSDLNILELIATHEIYHGLTVSGLYLELGHNLPNDVVIVDIQIGSSVAVVNSFYIQEMTTSIAYDDCLEEILYPATYDHLKVQLGEMKINIRRHQTKAFYIPLTYLREDLLLHRFYLKIVYDFQGKRQTVVIDDFPYIRQNILAYKEEEFDVYYPRMYSERIFETLQES